MSGETAYNSGHTATVLGIFAQIDSLCLPTSYIPKCLKGSNRIISQGYEHDK